MKSSLFFKEPLSSLRAGLWIVLFGALVHWGMLAAPFKTMDDYFSIKNNPLVMEPGHLREMFTSSFFREGHYYRPLVTLSFRLEYQLFGLNSFYYNLSNLVCHLTVALLVFFLIRRLVKDTSVALWTGLLFAVHPVHWEAVDNIAGRSILLNAVFGLSAFLLFLRAAEPSVRESLKKTIRQGWQIQVGLFSFSQKRPFGRSPTPMGRRFLAYVASLMCFVLAMLSKESAVMLPVVLAAYLWWMSPREPRGAWVRKWGLLIPYFLLVVGYVGLRHALGIVEVYTWRSFPEMVLGFSTFLRACLTFARLFIFPVDTHFDRSQRLFSEWTDPALWAVWVLVGVGVYAWFHWGKKRPAVVTFFTAWVVLELFPVSQVLATIGVQPGYISTAEHFLYLPSVGILALLVLGARGLARRLMERGWCSSRVLAFGAGGMLVFFMVITAQMSLQARDVVTMLERSLRHQPRNARLLYSLGVEKGLRGFPVEAERYFREALRLEPFQPVAQIGLGKALCDQGRYWDGIRQYEAVRHPGRFRTLLEDNLRAAYRSLIQRYRQRLAREPRNARIYFSLGVVYSKQGRLREAVEAYRRALRLDPGFKNARLNLKELQRVLGKKKDHGP